MMGTDPGNRPVDPKEYLYRGKLLRPAPVEPTRLTNPNPEKPVELFLIVICNNQKNRAYQQQAMRNLSESYSEAIRFTEKGQLKVNDISDQTRHDPAILLTIGRTIMANERTLLAFIRTSMAFLIMGIGLIKYLDHPVLDVLGWIFVVLAGVLFFWGLHRYKEVKKVLRDVTPEDQQSAEKTMGL